MNGMLFLMYGKTYLYWFRVFVYWLSLVSISLVLVMINVFLTYSEISIGPCFFLLQLHKPTKLTRKHKHTHFRLYNTVLNACAFSDKEDSRSAITCAVRILSEMPSSGGKYQRASPDAITYGTMLKCVAHLVPEEAERARGSMASGIFQRCRDDGMINSMILDSFRRAAPLVVQEELLVGSRGEPLGQSTVNNPTMIEELAVGDLPRSWTRNSKETGWAASRRKSGNNRPKVKDSEEEEDEDKDEDDEEETIVKFRSTSIYDSDHNTFLGF